ncbi:MAG TPA: glucose-6-phosphate dehydrogenase [Candidatus Saccharimonadales bacterium]|nr:glucose-6-phosphate dehydrogenase [Candidatus Saccharimonadales bacterium]
MSNPAPAQPPAEPPIRKADPCVMVIFGATGDLTKRKLLPALCNLIAAKLLPEQFAVIGVANNDLTTESFRAQLGEELKQFADAPVTPEMWDWLQKRLYYFRGEFEDATAFQQLKEYIAKVEKDHGAPGNHLYYLAVAPRFFGEVVKQLGAAGLAQETDGHWRRVVIEKPFGRDLDSAKALNADIKKVLEEPQIYRIDHYLGKETVQNIMIFRFGNSIFEPIWNRRYIDHVQITAAETVGVEQRGGYYETAGALRDMVPNHLFQLVSLTAMEPPNSFHADAVRDEQAKALHAIQIPTPEEVLTMAVRGQYGPGQVGDEKAVAYRAEPGVAHESTTETFAAVKVRLDNWRWAGVPFYIRTGKRLAERTTEIAIQFKQAPFQLFRDTPVENLETNRLVIHIQPEEGLSLRFGAKIPGPIMHTGPVEMKFNYEDYFGKTPSTGYERLIYDCMIGDATLFQRADMVEAGWSVITPILDVWKALPPRAFPNYASGSWGPKEADDLLARDARHWRKIG